MDIIWEVLLHNTQAHACMVLLQFKVSLYCSAFYHVLSMWQHCLANKRRPFTCQKISQHFFSIQPPSMHFFFIHPKRCNFSLIPSYMMRIFLLSKAGWQFDIMRVVTTAKIPFELCAKRMLTKSPDNMNNPFLILCCSIHTKSSVAGNSPTNCHVMVNDDRRKREVRAEGGGEAF